MAELQPMLTPKEVSKKLHVGMKRVYRMIKSKEIPSIRMGHRTIIIDSDDVLEYLRRLKQQQS